MPNSPERPDSDPHHTPVTSGAPRTPDAAPPTAPRTGPEAPRDEIVGGWSSQSPYLFHLAAWAPSRFDGGTLRGAIAENWDILKGQEGSVYLVRLEPGAVREPHWHPSAWELNFIISGSARWALLGTQGEHARFEAHAGDLVFAPQGQFHYFENAGDDELVVLIIFNTSAAEPRDDIGIVASLSVMPPDVLGMFMGVPAEVFEKMKRRIAPVTIARRPKT